MFSKVPTRWGNLLSCGMCFFADSLSNLLLLWPFFFPCQKIKSCVCKQALRRRTMKQCFKRYRWCKEAKHSAAAWANTAVKTCRGTRLRQEQCSKYLPPHSTRPASADSCRPAAELAALFQPLQQEVTSQHVVVAESDERQRKAARFYWHEWQSVLVATAWWSRFCSDKWIDQSDRWRQTFIKSLH